MIEEALSWHARYLREGHHANLMRLSRAQSAIRLITSDLPEFIVDVGIASMQFLLIRRPSTDWPICLPHKLSATSVMLLAESPLLRKARAPQRSP